ncbi:MAG: endonuclease/exonuclease/phosphatase family protein [Syntrophomonadaceae bacterium]|nr:endonuclease/exonuclease/phosphatase family protein [Syntrophomonadaceae bacterium]
MFNLHLGLKAAERYRHLQDIILPRVCAVSSPVLLGGDFNARPESSEIGLVKNCLQDSFRANSGECIHTFPSDQPCARIDYIFLSNRWELNDYKVIPDTQASDHLPLVCEVTIQP